jgi:AcrR family transcriptional regulator
MARYATRRSRSNSRRTGKADNQTTRQRLLEAAGQVFADKGFSGTTGKEICELAGTNTAAINYYFGGVDALYTAVLHEARNRLVTTEDVVQAIAGKADAKAKLEALVGLVVPAITGPMASSWAVRVLGREIVSPSPALEPLLKDVTIRIGIMRSIVAELMGLPEDHPAVTRGIIGVMGPCLMLLLYDRRTFRRIFPDFGLTSKDNAAVIRHWVQFTLGGLSAIARDLQGQT